MKQLPNPYKLTRNRFRRAIIDILRDDEYDQVYIDRHPLVPFLYDVLQLYPNDAESWVLEIIDELNQSEHFDGSLVAHAFTYATTMIEATHAT